MCNSDKFICEFCGRECNTHGGLLSHLRGCKLNPDHSLTKPGGWVCDTCNSIFKTRRQLKDHYKEYTDHKIKKSTAGHFISAKCEFCSREWETTVSGASYHYNHCKLNPNRISAKSHTHTDESKKKLSHIMKQKHALGIAPTFADLRRNCEPSYPERWLMKVIENENLNKHYTREYKFHTFSLDFAWVDDKAVIEVDGRFHKISDYQKDCDKRKDALLLQEGWRELRLDWEYCCNNTREAISSIKDFLSQCVLTTQPFCKKVGHLLSTTPKSVKKKVGNTDKSIKQHHKVAKIAHNDKPKHYGSLVNEELKALRWSIIENSNIDFQKYGWVSEIAKLFNLPPTKAGAYIRKHFPEFYSTCFVRK